MQLKEIRKNLEKMHGAAILFHMLSVLALLLECIRIMRVPISMPFFWVFGITLFIFLLSYICIKCKSDVSTVDKLYWYVVFLMGTMMTKIFTSCLNAINMFSGVSYVLIVLLLVGLTFFFLWTSKNTFSRTIHIVNIILVCTYLLFELAELFSYYYIYVYDVAVPAGKYLSTASGTSVEITVDFWGRTLENIKPVIRYFFEFPPQEYVDMVTILQFIIGKVYEGVLLGGIIGGLTSAFVNKKTDEKA